LPVIAFAGRVTIAADQSSRQYFDRLISINENTGDLEAAMKNTYMDLEKAAKRLGDLL